MLCSWSNLVLHMSQQKGKNRTETEQNSEQGSKRTSRTRERTKRLGRKRRTAESACHAPVGTSEYAKALQMKALTLDSKMNRRLGLRNLIKTLFSNCMHSSQHTARSWHKDQGPKGPKHTLRRRGMKCLWVQLHRLDIHAKRKQTLATTV